MPIPDKWTSVLLWFILASAATAVVRPAHGATSDRFEREVEGQVLRFRRTAPLQEDDVQYLLREAGLDAHEQDALRDAFATFSTRRREAIVEYETFRQMLEDGFSGPSSGSLLPAARQARDEAHGALRRYVDTLNESLDLDVRSILGAPESPSWQMLETRQLRKTLLLEVHERFDGFLNPDLVGAIEFVQNDVGVSEDVLDLMHRYEAELDPLLLQYTAEAEPLGAELKALWLITGGCRTGEEERIAEAEQRIGRIRSQLVELRKRVRPHVTSLTSRYLRLALDELDPLQSIILEEFLEKTPGAMPERSYITFARIESARWFRASPRWLLDQATSVDTLSSDQRRRLAKLRDDVIGELRVVRAEVRPVAIRYPRPKNGTPEWNDYRETLDRASREYVRLHNVLLNGIRAVLTEEQQAALPPPINEQLPPVPAFMREGE